MTRIKQALVTLVIPLLGPACVEEDSLVVSRSDLLVLYAPQDYVEQDMAVCDGTFEKMEHDVYLTRKMFKSNTAVPIHYYWLPAIQISSDEFPCTASGHACTIEQTIYARTLASTHELVHASRATAPRVLEEGMATLLSDPYHRLSKLVAREELFDAFEAGTFEQASDPIGLYERSAHFVSFLIAEWGLETFLEFNSRGYSYLASFDEWTQGFEHVYGASFQQVWMMYGEYPDCPPVQFHMPVSACDALGGTATPATTLTAAYSLESGPADDPDSTFIDSLDCAEGETFGPYSYDGKTSRGAMSVVEIDNWLAGSVWIELVGDVDAGSRAAITACGSCWDGVGALLSHEERKILSNVPSGTYALIRYQDMTVDGGLGVSLHY